MRYADLGGKAPPIHLAPLITVTVSVLKDHAFDRLEAYLYQDNKQGKENDTHLILINPLCCLSQAAS